MQKKEKTRINILCPFLERECPLGEELAQICWRKLYSGEAGMADYDGRDVDCLISDWMYKSGAFSTI